VKRFLVFAGEEDVQGGGGWKDFRDSFATLGEAEALGGTEPTDIRRADWVQIVDTEIGIVIRQATIENSREPILWNSAHLPSFAPSEPKPDTEERTYAHVVIVCRGEEEGGEIVGAVCTSYEKALQIGQENWPDYPKRLEYMRSDFPLGIDGETYTRDWNFDKNSPEGVAK